MKKSVNIVYYGYINPSVKWWNIIGGQLSELKSIGILEVADLYIHLTGPDQEIELATRNIKNLIPNSIISTSNENQYEYRGIHLTWELATKYPDSIFLYFHSKGMSHGENERLLHERKLFKGTIGQWQKVISVFKENNHINKVGFSPSEAGWVWFNFWWARGKYLSECEEPILTERRHYYEDWLHRKINTSTKSSPHECYSLYESKSGIFYEPHEACINLNKVMI